eukprot:193426_1
MSTSVISAINWIPRGCAMETPEQFEMTPAEMMAIKQAESTGEAESMTAQEAASGDTLAEEDAFMRSLNMDTYDDEDDGVMSAIARAPTDDSTNELDDGGNSTDDEDQEVKATDDVFVVGRTDEEQQSSVEVYVYDSAKGSLYVHHDFNIPAFPLCFEWMNVDPRSPSDSLSQGSFLAVGSFEPSIEIWNLDVMDVMEPACVLGGRDEPTVDARVRLKRAMEKSKKKKQSKKIDKLKETALLGELKPGSHSDAVLCLSWNTNHRTLLASGSADSTVKLWDICGARCLTTLTDAHAAKVQAVQWHPAETTVLLSGGYDRVAAVTDTRCPAEKTAKYAVDSDVERAQWDPHAPARFAVSTESGSVHFFDVRKGSEAVMTINAHQAACSGLSFNPCVPGLMATASLSQSVKLWDTSSSSSAECIATRRLETGQIFALSFSSAPFPFLLSAGGQDGDVALWDVLENSEVRRKYGEIASKMGVRLGEYEGN